VADNDAIIRILRGNRWSEAHFDDRGNVYETRQETAPERNERIKALAIQANAAAALTQAQAEKDRVEYEARLAGILPHGDNSNPTSLFLAPSVASQSVPGAAPMETDVSAGTAATIPPALQQQMFDQEYARATNKGIPIQRILGDLGQKYNEDAPGVATLIAGLRAERPPDLLNLAQGRSAGWGESFDNFMSRLVQKPISYFYPDAAPQSPEEDARALFYQTPDYRDERQRALHLMRRFAPDLFPSEYRNGLF
jgi:hypothetical protein